MKNLIKFWVGAAAMILAATGCAENEPDRVIETGDGDGLAKITIGIKSEAPATRALISDVADALTGFESGIKNFDAYVFDWDSGFLEASGHSDDGGDFSELNVVSPYFK